MNIADLLKKKKSKSTEEINEDELREREALVKIRERVLDEIFMEKLRLSVEEGRCLMAHYCTHFFAIGHDGRTREESEHIFSCWKLSNCFCVFKKKGHCDECSRKKQDAPSVLFMGKNTKRFDLW